MIERTEIFAKGLPRPAVLGAVVAAFSTVPTNVLTRAPAFCLWGHFFQIGGCPACGSTRALAAFFHGQFTQALAFNRNVLITGPLILMLLGFYLIGLMRQVLLRHLTPGVKGRVRIRRDE